VLGVRPVAVEGHGVPAPLPPAYVEVVRRTGDVLRFRVPPEERQLRLDLLVGLLVGPGDSSGPAAQGSPATGSILLPPWGRDWVERTGRRTAARLRAGGYVVHGSLRSLGRSGKVGGEAAGKAGGSAGVRDRAVLAALEDSVLRAQAAHGGGGRGAMR
jgi:hypothetical protein